MDYAYGLNPHSRSIKRQVSSTFQKKFSQDPGNKKPSPEGGFLDGSLVVKQLVLRQVVLLESSA